MSRAPCVKCGNILHTGEGRILMGFTVEELRELAESTGDLSVRRRIVCAISLLDEKLARELG